MPSAIGYILLSEAEAYFLTRLSSTAWTGTDAVKTAALTTAYDRLYYSGLFDLPLLGEATAAQLIILKKAQCEMAYYMLGHLADEDRRKGLQAQGVVAAGIVKEQYAEADLMKLPIPPFVAALLEDFSTAGDEFYVSAVERDEDEGLEF
jgi:hypothetical protein